jgi:hypothetical protein
MHTAVYLEVLKREIPFCNQLSVSQEEQAVHSDSEVREDARNVYRHSQITTDKPFIYSKWEASVCT